jgi:hypothetical protein
MERSEIAPFRRSLWLGLSPELYDLLYKVSFLLRMMPLDSEQQGEALILSQRLEALHLMELWDGGPDHKAVLTGMDALVAKVRRLYIAATELILLKILHRDIEAADGRMQRLLLAAIADLLSIKAITQHITPLVICPVAILGTAAIRDRDREFLASILKGIRNLTGRRELDSVLTFLQGVWGEIAGEPGPKSAQLDVWLDYSRLRCVTL